MLLRVILNSLRVGIFSSFLKDTYGKVFVMALPYCLFSSFFKIFVTFLLFCFLPFILNLYINLRFPLSFCNKIWESKVSLVFMQLNPPISVFSNNFRDCWHSNTTFTFITVYATVKRTCWIAFEIVEFDFFYLKSSLVIRKFHVIVSWELPSLLNSPKFTIFNILYSFLTDWYSSSEIMLPFSFE